MHLSLAESDQESDPWSGKDYLGLDPGQVTVAGLDDGDQGICQGRLMRGILDCICGRGDSCIFVSEPWGVWHFGTFAKEVRVVKCRVETSLCHFHRKIVGRPAGGDCTVVEAG